PNTANFSCRAYAWRSVRCNDHEPLLWNRAPGRPESEYGPARANPEVSPEEATPALLAPRDGVPPQARLWASAWARASDTSFERNSWPRSHRTASDRWVSSAPTPELPPPRGRSTRLANRACYACALF